MSKKENMDDFWDISSLIPPAKKPIASPPKKISAVEITVGEDKSEAPNADNSLKRVVREVQTKAKESPVEYTPANPLIKAVKISDWSNSGNYYELFCRQAEYYAKIKPTECEHVHFFSYMPQFSQMSRAQLDWYLWWKNRVENKIFLNTDVTYVLLYVFELINLSDESNSQKALNTMIDLWANYHDTYPQLNKTLGEWICDFSFVHRLPITFPDKRLTREMITSVSIPEVFYSFDFSDIPLLTKFLLSYCNSYNYRKSKAYDEKNAELYEKHIPAIIQKVIRESGLSEKIFTETLKKLSRTAFMGALCSSKAKKRIEISFVSLALENELRANIADMIKYSENKLRWVLGIRSRLSVKSISDDIKAIIDNYFNDNFNKSDICFNAPEYEKLYEAKSEPLSFEAAKEIEQRSWDITQKLVEAFEDEPDEQDSAAEIQSAPTEVNEPPHQENGDDDLASFYSLIKQYAELFSLIKDEKYQEQITYVKKNRIIFEAAADEINDAAAEVFGDILIEEAEIGYRIIEDYKEIFDL